MTRPAARRRAHCPPVAGGAGARPPRAPATLPRVRVFLITLAAALIGGFVARLALDLPLVVASLIALVVGLAADKTARRTLAD